jgi:hypothetical protein
MIALEDEQLNAEDDVHWGGNSLNTAPTSIHLPRWTFYQEDASQNSLSIFHYNQFTAF